MQRHLLAAPALALCLSASPARAEGLAVALTQVAPGSIKLNGVLSEWPTAMTPLSTRVQGSPADKDFSARVALAYDDAALYVAADVLDDKLVRTASYGDREDRFTLTIVFPGDGGALSTAEIALYPGDPGNVAGAVRVKGGGGGQLVEAPNASKSGYSFEAKIPWSALPAAALSRVGLRGVVRGFDSDGGGVESVLATSAEASPARLPRLPIDAEEAIETTFAKEKGLTGAPQHDVIADVTAGSSRERVMLWDQYLLVAGPEVRGGKEFFFRDLAVDRSMIPSFEVRDLTGDGKADIVVRTKKTGGGRLKEELSVLSMSGEAMSAVFVHELSLGSDAGRVDNTVSFDPGKREITVSLAASTAARDSFKETPEPGDGGVLLPWGTVKSRTFRFDGGKFTKVREEAKPASEAPPAKREPTGPAQPPPARPPTADELMDNVLALYKKDRKVRAGDRPRFDLAANLADDAQNERLLVFGKDLVVFGKGFMGGQGYVAVSLGLADAKDVVDVATRDLDGDGHAEVLVRGVQRMPAPKELGTGKIERDVLLVYSLLGGKLTRVFAAETGIAVGDKRLLGTVTFVPGAKAHELVLGPGVGVGWDRASWPYKQDTTPVGGIEPLVLPWSDAVARYRWSGSAFTR
ncbi:MAG: hypothetical protein IT374_25085 [Polyangiaceae bacterium]|nr:hypothetical protein [Polyangiaceae bacterium]